MPFNTVSNPVRYALSAPSPSNLSFETSSSACKRSRTLINAFPSRFSPQLPLFDSAFAAPYPIPQILSKGEAYTNLAPVAQSPTTNSLLPISSNIFFKSASLGWVISTNSLPEQSVPSPCPISCGRSPSLSCPVLFACVG